MGAGATDKFGFRLGTKRALAAQLFERGAAQAEIKAAIGYTHYNMLKDAERRGHRVKRNGNRFWLLPTTAITDIEADVEQVQKRDGLTTTEKETLIQARRGQGLFRQDVMKLWGCCAVTGCSVPAVLEACHIKPWSTSTDAERLDAENGLCLVANLHKLFDAGLITFDDGGQDAGFEVALTKGSRNSQARRAAE
jgi:predicted restriction endonuclease